MAGKRKRGNVVVKRSKRRTTKIIKPRVPLNGMQNSEIIKLRYVQHITIGAGSAAGLPVTYNFRANSLWDPDWHTGGHKPMGMDQMSAKYNHYQVLGSRIKIKNVPMSTNSAAGSNPSWVTLKLSDNMTADYANFEGLLESRPYGKNKKMFASNYLWGNPYGDAGSKTLTAYYDPKKMFGLNKTALRSEEKLIALVTDDPAEDALFQIQAWPIGTNATRDPVNLLVEIDFTARFTEPKDLSMS